MSNALQIDTQRVPCYTMPMRCFFRPLDYVVFALFLAVAVSSVVALRKNRSGSPLLVVNTPHGEYVYPLDKNREVSLEGLLGDSVLVIQDGKAFFKESPCPNQICVQTSALSHNGDWSACLPNQIIMHIENKSEETELDALSS